MATYKLIQDIEAEDHILGPLTLRQFIFALITAFLLYIDFLMVVKHVSFLLLVFLPPTLLTGFFAFPFGRDQPTEVWALGKLRYWFKPHLRLWNQSGVKELVTITVPKKLEHVYTNGLTQVEVKSRLKALASTIDSRGWAIKNINVDSYTHNPLAGVSSDRLLNIEDVPQQVPDEEPPADYDMLDEQNSPIAQQFDSMINQSAQTHHQTLLDRMNQPAPAAPSLSPKTQQPPAAPADYWFINSSPAAPAVQAQPAPAVAADPSAEERALAAKFKQQASTSQATYGHMHTLQPLSTQPILPAPTPSPAPASIPPRPTSSQPADPAILSLADNDDLDVATLAREAHKNKGEDEDEVVIPLR